MKNIVTLVVVIAFIIFLIALFANGKITQYQLIIGFILNLIYGNVALKE